VLQNVYDALLSLNTVISDYIMHIKSGYRRVDESYW